MKNKRGIFIGISIIFLFLITILFIIKVNANSHSSSQNDFSSNYNAVNNPDQLIEITPVSSTNNFTEAQFFIKDNQVGCQGSVCSFEFTIINALSYDKKLDSSNLLLWYNNLASTSNIRSFKYYQLQQINKTEILTSASCSYQVIGAYENSTPELNYVCTDAETTTNTYSDYEWKEVSLQDIILKANSKNKFKVEAYFNPVIGENSIDWKIALNDYDTGYLEPNWILFNASKDAYRNITFTNTQGLARIGERVEIFLNLNATTNLTIGFTAKNIQFNGQNYSIGYKTSTSRGIDDLQLVNDSFTSVASEVAFEIINTTQSYLTTRDYPDSFANTSYIGSSEGSSSYFSIGNGRLTFRVSNSSGGVNKITAHANTRNGVISSSGNNNRVSVHDTTGGYIMGFSASNTCVLKVNNDVRKIVACSGGVSNFNYTVYEGTEFIAMELVHTSGSQVETRPYELSALWGEDRLYYDGANNTGTVDDANGVTSGQNVSVGVNDNEFVDWFVWGLPGNSGNAFYHGWQESAMLGRNVGGGQNGKIPANTKFTFEYGFSDVNNTNQENTLNGARGTILWNIYANPLAITVSPEFSTTATSSYNLQIEKPTTANPQTVTAGENITIEFNFSKDGINQETGINILNVTIGNKFSNILGSWYNGAWKVNITTPSGLTGSKDLFVNATFESNVRSDTETNAISYSSPVNTTYNFTYDNNGNLISGFEKSYEYNDFNQLKRVRNNNTNVLLEEYWYDNEGNRIKKYDYIKNETVYYINKNLVQIRNSTGTFNEIYYYDEQDLIAKKDNLNKTIFYHPDELGSTNLVTDNNGNVVERTNYGPYGDILEGGDSRFTYTGKEKDIQSGLNYYGARYYEADTLKHFTQPDSVIQDIYNPQSLNRYSYVLNNPYKYVDPTGNYVESAIDIAFIIYDINELRQEQSLTNYLALGGDVIGAALPFATGIGMGVRGVVKGVDLAKDASKLNKIENIRGLGEKELSAFKTIDNIKNIELTDKTLKGARIESKGGITMLKQSGEPFDHITKVQNAQKGLENQIKTLQNSLRDPKLSPQAKKAIEKKLSETSKLLDKSERYVPKNTPNPNIKKEG